MSWIVIGEESGRLKLVSKSSVGGMLPKGAFLTIENGSSKHILRVEESRQEQPYSPSPLIAEMDLKPLREDQACQNIIIAARVCDVSSRVDGLVDFIPPQLIARQSTQQEIDLATGTRHDGAPVFVATLHGTQNQVLRDHTGSLVRVRLPDEMFFHQILVCGKTGSGKTVATKYLAQYFVEQLEGAVLAVNVKDIDLLQMDQPSASKNPAVSEEWKALGSTAHGIDNYTIYYPANIAMQSAKGVNPARCTKITLNVAEIDPEALTGLLQGISDLAAQNFPSIFRYWQQSQLEKGNNFSFAEFVRYYDLARHDGRTFRTMSGRGDLSQLTLHAGTYDNIKRNLDYATDFFDNRNAQTLHARDVLRRGTMSVINVAGSKGVQFGSVLLRDLLHKIVDLKDNMQSDVPILILIDEVHQFYNTDNSKEALGDLDTICRTGRSKRIGVIFSSQNPSDIPRGLSSVINTQIFFKSDSAAVRHLGVKITEDEAGSLRKGFAVSLIHELPQVRVIKFPLAYAGVLDGGA